MSKAEEAFSRAAMCADQAQAAQDEEWRTFFKRLRDSWVRVPAAYPAGVHAAGRKPVRRGLYREITAKDR